MLIAGGKKVNEGIHYNERPLQSCFHQNNVYNGIEMKVIYFCLTRWNGNSALVLREKIKQKMSFGAVTGEKKQSCYSLQVFGSFKKSIFFSL